MPYIQQVVVGRLPKLNVYGHDYPTNDGTAMAYDLHSMLMGATILSPGETLTPAYGGPESFLNKVVCPIYDVIRKEAKKNQNGMTDHSNWRNYDDLNEFFWSPDCFELGWPMNQDHDFYYVPDPEDPKSKKKLLINLRRRKRKNWMMK